MTSGFCYIPSVNLFDSIVKLGYVKSTSPLCLATGCDHKAMISLEESSKSGRNVGCERGEKKHLLKHK